VDVFPANDLHYDGIDVLPCGGGRFPLDERVETVMLVRMIKEEGVCVFIADIVYKGTHHSLARGHRHPLRIVSAVTVILVVAVL
jgi:hypothetical protein